MPATPKQETDRMRTRSQREREVDERRFGSPLRAPGGGENQPTTELDAAAAAGSSTGPSCVPVAPSFDFSSLMALLQEQARKQDEQARKQEEQARRLEEQLLRDKEEQARRLEEQLQRDREEQAHRQEEQARRQEEQTLLIKDLHATFGQELKDVKEQVHLHEKRFSEAENRISETEAQIVDVKKALGVLKSGSEMSAPVVTASSARGFKVPPFDGSSSWSAYKIQLEAVVKANGWSKAQAMTALTLGLRDQALTILEALGKDVTYEQLLEALESRYGDAHLEHVFRAQLKDRAQRNSENLQQWALEIEKLVRKAYQSSPALIDGILIQAFIDGIRDMEVRSAVRLGHHESLKDAVAHALEVEAVRQDPRAHRIREVVASPPCDTRRKFSPRCYECGEKGHLRFNYPRRVVGREVRPQQVRVVSNATEQTQGNE